MLLAGDAAAFIDPFAGDGISLALHGGVMAAQALIPFVQPVCISCPGVSRLGPCGLPHSVFPATGPGVAKRVAHQEITFGTRHGCALQS